MRPAFAIRERSHFQGLRWDSRWSPRERADANEAGTESALVFQRYIDIDRMGVDKNGIDIKPEKESRWDGSVFML